VRVVLGKNHHVDESVILGYPPGRKIPISESIIGNNARIRSNTVIYTNVSIGDDLETGHNVVIREENVIGDNFNIWNNSTVDYGCKIGDNVRIHCNVYVAQFTTIESGVFIAPSVVIANDPHPICTKCMQGPTIKEGARIGVGAVLFPRIVIGEYSFVGAGSVVTKNIPPKAVVYGNPARVIKTVDELTCPLGIVDQPYKDGLDVRTRSIEG
jgi:acetyltransferase-like isoleucine patch superfamily enzyme